MVTAQNSIAIDVMNCLSQNRNLEFLTYENVDENTLNC